MQIHPLGVLWRRLTFILFIYFFTYSFIYFFIIIIIIYFFFLDSVIIFVVIEIFLLGLFCPRLDWEYLCPELLGILGQIDDGFNGLSKSYFRPNR